MRKKNLIVACILMILISMNFSCSHITHGIASIISLKYPGALYFVNTDQKAVALTIDDGPDPVTTFEILEVLEQYDSKATFFLISSHVTGNKNVVNQIVRQGHELGNHMTYDEPTYKLKHSDFVSKFNEAGRMLSQFAKTNWFRPGSGFYSSNMISYLNRDERGYLCALGSVYPFDAEIPSSFFSIVFISLNVKPGSIIILHDRGQRGKRTVKTLKRILPRLQSRGYKVITLTELYNARSRE